MSQRVRRAIWVALCGAVLSGCASEEDGGGGGGGGDAADGGRDVAEADGGQHDGGDAAADAQAEVGVDAVDEPGPPETSGVVAVFETRSPSVEALRAGGLAASFTASPPPAPEAIARIGACDVVAVGPDDTLFPDVPTLDAGAIRVRLGQETFTLSLQDGAGGPRYVADAPAGRLEFFTNGLTVRVEADGGADVPAFSGSVSAPAEPVISAPDWGASTSGTHAADQDLTVSWTVTGRGEVIVSLVPIQVLPEPGLAEGNGITCTAADAGTFTVPAAALAYLSGGGDFGPNVALSVIVPVNATVRAGAAEVTINATASHTVVGAIR